jgi:hypothetical protein
MISIDFETLLTIIYVLVDDWYQAEGVQLMQGKPGVKPVFSDREIITLLVAMDFVPFPGETQFLGFIRANYRALFPHWEDQGQFNRRARSLRLVVEALRRHWAHELGVGHETQFLLDTNPCPSEGINAASATALLRAARMMATVPVASCTILVTNGW